MDKNRESCAPSDNVVAATAKKSSLASICKLDTFTQFNPFPSSRNKSKSKSVSSCDIRMGNPNPEDVTLTTGAIKRKKKSFEIFHWKFILLSVLFVFGLCGTTIMWFTTIYHDEIFKTLTLGNGTKLHVAWKNPPLKPLLCVHIFNYTNVHEYFSDDNKDGENKGKIKLKVKDTGPYCFREEIERTNIVFLNNGTSLSYNERRIHTFDVEASKGSLNDTVYVPNVLILSLYKAVRDSLRIIRTPSYMLVKDAEVIKKVNVSDYLFGYEDGTFSVITGLKSFFSSSPKKIPKRFGVLMKRTGLSNDTIVIRTGDGALDEMGQVTEINNITDFEAWKSASCDLVSGSDGLFFKRSAVQNHRDVQLFHKDSCRTLPLTYESTVDVGSGIMANRYKLRSDIFDYSRRENSCFCNISKSCERVGVLDISTCSAVSEAPMVISRPHFLDSNANLDENNEPIIEGFEPDIAKHDFRIDIFPPIGLTVRTLMRMQLNIMVNNPENDAEGLRPFNDKTILPIVWVEMNSGEVPEKMFSLLYHLTYTMRWAELALKLIFVVFTFLMAFLLFKISFVKSSTKKDFVLISKKRKSNGNMINSVYVPS
ncbi:lysosome membrane protein 2-like [Planococcus citri]|uniref:lysosome membrane protein 2-like n=1 Tax=Planococcus citri TaxID=170843 RepID=UPI0031F7950D